MNPLVCCVLLLAAVQIAASLTLPEEESSRGLNATIGSERQSRAFQFYSLGRITNSQCVGSNGLLGTCLIRGECADNNGLATGFCNAHTSQAVCCVNVGTCDGSSSNNVTYFQNSGYPLTVNGENSCTYTIVPPDNTVCQLRIDFNSFTLAQPDASGICSTDYLQIIGGSSIVQPICGDNSGQHLYVSFSGTSPITLTVATSASFSLNRQWNLQLSMISCTSPYLAPGGCLQYFLDSSGEVASFNYGSPPNPNQNKFGLTGTRQLANSNYGICIRTGDGQCSITYSLASGDIYAFTVTGDVGMGAMGATGAACTTDYVVIPNPSGTTADRFCGTTFGGVTSSFSPFVLYYITNENDVNDVANRGFKLAYSQNACPI